ncbi:MAG TPA: response regulator transcription factor [Actinomycetota bacterium]
MSEPIRVVVADDHPVWRDGVAADLSKDPAIEVVGQAGDGGEAVDVVRETMPDVVLMDLNMPVTGGAEATRIIHADSPHVRVLILSASGEEADVLEAVKAGAGGYLLKSATGDELREAIRRIAEGEPVFTASLAGLVLGEFRRMASGGAASAGGEPGLTPRETEVLTYVAKGYVYKDIAEKLFISVKTVQNHVQNILSKLHLSGRYDLMRYAIRKGLDKT